MGRGRALLVLKPRYIGDAVLALPLLDHLLSAFESVAVCASLQLKPIFRDRVCAWLPPPEPGILGGLRWRREVRGVFDAAFLANRSFRSALQVRLAGVPHRVGHRTEARGLLLTTAVPYSRTRCEVESLLDLAGAYGLEIRAERPWLPRLAEPTSKVLLQPGARHPWKRPPWTTLARAVAQAGVAESDLELVGSPAEVEACRTFARQFFPKAAISAGKTDLEGVMRLLCRGRVFLAGDTGLVHLAAAMGVPTLAFLSPHLAPKWGWHEDRNRTLTTEASVAEAAEALRRILAPAQCS
ncbi:MAG: glycosyltransferase family 9 protein [Fimbriimonadales bacterium]